MTRDVVDGLNIPDRDVTNVEGVVKSTLEGRMDGSFTFQTPDVVAEREIGRLKSEGIGVINPNPGELIGGDIYRVDREVVHFLGESAPFPFGRVVQVAEGSSGGRSRERL